MSPANEHEHSWYARKMRAAGMLKNRDERIARIVLATTARNHWGPASQLSGRVMMFTTVDDHDQLRAYMDPSKVDTGRLVTMIARSYKVDELLRDLYGGTPTFSWDAERDLVCAIKVARPSKVLITRVPRDPVEMFGGTQCAPSLERINGNIVGAVMDRGPCDDRDGIQRCLDASFRLGTGPTCAAPQGIDSASNAGASLGYM